MRPIVIGLLFSKKHPNHVERTAQKATRAARLVLVGGLVGGLISARPRQPEFRVIAFFTAKEDQAHISFVHEAVRWFPEVAVKYHFRFDTTSQWGNLNDRFLAGYQVVVFLDTRPEEPAQRVAFQSYMERGGAWMGFRSAGFALTAFRSARDRSHRRFGTAATIPSCGVTGSTG